MTDAQKKAFEYFKRNKQAAAVHVVLDKVFNSLQRATTYKKSAYAKKVSSFLRHEFTTELKEENPISTPDPIKD